MAITKLTVNLTEKSAAALVRAQEHSTDSKTDTVNRALQLYAWWVEKETLGFTHHIHHSDGRVSDAIHLK